MNARSLSPVAALWLLAAAQYFWIAPRLARLPADYSEETGFAARARFRDNPGGEWTESMITARRVDQILTNSASHAIIQGDLHWANNEGIVEYENRGIYGVDRYTRLNLPGYGNAARSGSFLFPPHVERKNYAYWDPQFIGGRMATFDREDSLGGVQVYVFRFSGTGLDETAGYTHLPDVPYRYRVYTDGRGSMWVEPVSGTMVDYEEQGVSYFVKPTSGEKVADFYTWSGHYTPRTKTDKLEKAVTARWRILALESWLPLALSCAGLIYLGAILSADRRRLRKLRRMEPDPKGSLP